MKAVLFGNQCVERVSAIRTPQEERPRVAKDARHMSEEFARTTGALARVKISEVRWGAAYGLLRAVRKRCEKVSQQGSFGVVRN
jgi:hypothetical protein